MARSFALCRDQQPTICLLALLVCLAMGVVGTAPTAAHAAPYNATAERNFINCPMGANAVVIKGRSNPKRHYARSTNPKWCATTRYDTQDWEIYTANTVFYNRCCTRLFSVNGVRQHSGNDEHKCVTTTIPNKCGVFCAGTRCGLSEQGGVIVDGGKVRRARSY